MDDVTELMEDLDEILHYGVGHDKGGNSGRWPWGSGKDPYQRDDMFDAPYASPKDFYDDVNRMRKAGLTEREIVKALKMNTSSELRASYRAAEAMDRNLRSDTAAKLRDEGKTLREIAKIMGYKNDSSVRTLLEEDTNYRKNQQFVLAEKIRDAVDQYGLIDVGEGTEQYLGCTASTLEQVLFVLQAEYGYQVKGKRTPQLTNPGKTTVLRVACPPDAPNDVLYHLDEQHRIYRMENFGNNPDPNQAVNLKPTFSKPTSMARDRLKIVYKEEGGIEKDGLFEIRPGVKDLSLNGSLYSQIRVCVDNDDGDPSYYLKGMAVYGDPKSFPDGVDIIMYSNKKQGTADKDVMKPLKKNKDGSIDWADPFGSRIKDDKDGGQYWYIDDDGKEKLGLINKRADEGDWLAWKDALPAQFLAKQNPAFVKNQLNYTMAERYDQFERLTKLTNPALKKSLLEEFASEMDSQAVHLKAASLPRQKYEVLLPMPSLKDNECYCTNFETGDKVALIRFPHAGPFEIPILTVNNRNQEGIRMIGKTSQDAIGINKYNANKLSGADFDGDTAIGIPLSETVNITATPSLKGLEGFDTKEAYPPKYRLDANGGIALDKNGDPIIESEVMSKKHLQNQMGQISNLITDMTLGGASEEELARAVKHSMVVVDSPKHKLDYKKSEVDNGILELKKKYQLHDWKDWEGKIHKGAKSAATIISRAKAQYSAPVHEGYEKTDPETGKKVYSREKYKTVFDAKHTPYEEIEYVDPNTGEVTTRRKYDYKQAVYKTKTRKSTWMAETSDAMTLVRDKNNKIEIAYAEYANALKQLANDARKEAVNTPNMKYDPKAAMKYAAEVDHLMNELALSEMNKPREREATVLGGILYDEYINSLALIGEKLDKAEDKKIRDKKMKEARLICGARRHEIEITDKDWEAIQAGAISHTKAEKIFQKADSARLYDLAMPKEGFVMTPVKENRLLSMLNNGHTTSEIAQALGTSISTIQKYITERGER